MEMKDLLTKMNGKTADEQAKMLANFVADSKRKKIIDDERKAIRDKIFKDCKKLNKSQQEALIWEFLAENANYINTQFLRKKHAKLFSS